MSLFSLFGALEIGLIFSLVALGVFISFRLLRFPDLTVDGSFPLGGAVCATLIALGWDPYSATLAATAAGALAGLATGLLNVKLKIMDLLASILMMIALYSINLRIMGKPNVPLIAEPTLFTLLQPEWLSDYVFRPLLLVFIVIAAKLLLDWFFTTQKGLAIRANRVARVFQDPMAGTCEDLTIEENMALAQRRGAGRGLGRAVQASMRDGFRESLATLGLGLENRLGDRIGLLSGGQRQAVSLLMAALQPSRILLLDEHTAALDPRTADFVLHLTARIVAEKKLTTMMVTHSMRQALDVGERTVMLHQGQVVLDVSGEQRKGLDVPDLLAMFEKVRGEKLADDALLLG